MYYPVILLLQGVKITTLLRTFGVKPELCGYKKNVP